MSTRPFFKGLLIWVYLLLFLYFGAGAYLGANLDAKLTANKPSGGSDSSHVIYKDVDFKNLEEVKEFVVRESAVKFFSWSFILPLKVSILVLAFCSGAFGGIIRIFKGLAIDKQKITEIPTTYFTFLAGFLGFMVLGVSLLLPAALTVTENIPRPIAIMFLSIFGGFFCENTIKWLENQYNKLFPR